MEQKKLDSEITVSGQISLEDLQQLHASGVKTIICNRFDHEDRGQADFQVIANAAKELGMDAYFMPVASGRVTEENGEQFGKLLDQAQKPVHAYCRSGMRCATLWALSELKRGVDRETLIKKTAEAGYNVLKAI